MNQYANLFQQLIAQYEDKILQFVLCDDDGQVILSNNSLFKISAQDSIFDIFMPLATMQESIQTLGKEDLFLPRLETNIEELQGIYDVTIKRTYYKKHKLLFLVIHDNTTHNQYLKEVQQERNDAVISEQIASLKLKNETLKEEVTQRTQEILKQKNILEAQKTRIDDSISYALSIQRSLLPQNAFFKDTLFDLFILFQPKDIVSGDFYWFYEKDNTCFVVVADCTGHGIPAAMLSVIGSLYFNEIIQYTQNPAEMLTALNHKVKELFSNVENQMQISDGMDVSIVKIDTTQKIFTFAGAKRDAFYVNQGEMFSLQGDRNSINGYQLSKKEGIFHNQILPYEAGDMLYLFSDGYTDQFGGANNKKYMKGNFRILLQNIHPLPLHQQKYQLLQSFSNWKQDQEQTDDVLVVGVRLK